MKLIFGLGNPGTRYRISRHNVGFIILDYLAEKKKLSFVGYRNSMIAKGELKDSPFVFIKPMIYMNNSGIAVKEILDEYSPLQENFLVVYDDIYIKLGDLRIKQKGGDGGHNGLNSVINHLGINKFPRLRIGIKPENKIENIPDFVLSKFSNSELENLQPVFKLSSELIENFIEAGIKNMLDHYSTALHPAKNT